MRCVAVIPAALAALAAFAACGAQDGVSEGAVLNVYVEAPLCDPASPAETAAIPGEGSAARIRYVCLPSPRREGGIELARVGANARRASEDSTAIAFLERRDPAVNRFTHPILEEAGIGWVGAGSRDAAERRLLRALAESGSATREDLREALAGR